MEKIENIIFDTLSERTDLDENTIEALAKHIAIDLDSNGQLNTN
ncbi:hypothetical protein [Aquimarina sp. TRL1]|nr:hypothetical protein [Aquimarina sp. TRL1]